MGHDGKCLANRMENRIEKLVKQSPSPPVSGDRWRLEAGLSKHGYYRTQFWGCRYWGISVGEESMWGGASCLKVWTCKRDRASASWLRTPGMCLALKRMLWCKQIDTNFRTKAIRTLSLQVCLLMTWTRASLSVKNKIHWLLISTPHRYKLKTIGYNSRMAIFWYCQLEGHFP